MALGALVLGSAVAAVALTAATYLDRKDLDAAQALLAVVR
jgi:hypothetical protein